MPTIKSDLMNKQDRSGSMREFEVSDETENWEHLAAQVSAANVRLTQQGLPPMPMPQHPQGQQQPQPQSSFQQPSSFQQVQPYDPNFDKGIKEARRAKATGRERLSEAARRRVEMLCGMFTATREIDLNGNIFIVRTLKSKENREAMMAAAEHDGTVGLAFEMRKQLLARALVQIAGTEVELFLGDDSVEAKLEFLDELEESILLSLYETYISLTNETNKKYSFKSEQDMKEVSEDLKK